jgi:hypothetical protein
MGGNAGQDDPTLISIGSRHSPQSSPHIPRWRLLFAASKPASTTERRALFQIAFGRRKNVDLDACARHVQALGAGIAVRRSVIEEIGGFDSTLCSAPDPGFHPVITVTLPYALSLHAYHAYETSRIAVKHFGYAPENRAAS